jgi:hypothetical protein
MEEKGFVVGKMCLSMAMVVGEWVADEDKLSMVLMFSVCM